MPVGLGSRFLLEAVFLVVVAVVAGVEQLSPVTIVFVMAGAWLLVAVVEWIVSRARRAGRRPTLAGLPQAEWHGSVPVAIEPEVPVGRSPEPGWLELVEAQQQAAEREPVAEPEPEPEVMPGPTLDPVREEEPEPEPEREPDAVPEPPRIAAVAPVSPEPEPMTPAPRPVVTMASRRRRAQEWNLWELERLTRDLAGDDLARDEERSFLLMYLRDFADADGMLPSDFDGLVRDSFFDLFDAARS